MALSRNRYSKWASEQEHNAGLCTVTLPWEPGTMGGGGLYPLCDGLWFLYGALDSHPFFPSHAALGHCFLTASSWGGWIATVRSGL